MKKILMYGLTLFLVAILTMSGTYAYFTGRVTRRNAVEAKTTTIQAIYTGDEPIEGELQLTIDKSGGERREVSIAMTENSTPLAANFYIHADSINEGFSHPATKWEFYEVVDDEEVYLADGTLEGLTSGNKRYLKTNVPLTTEIRKFAVYIWVNGWEAGNEVKGAELKGYIGAETAPVTGNLTE